MKLTRTLTTTAITASLLLPLAACSQPTQQAPQDTAPQTEQAQPEEKPEEKAQDDKNTLLADAVWPENELTALAPKPEFSVPLKDVDATDSESIQKVRGEWNGATQDEVAAYIQKLKDAGYNTNISEHSDTDRYSFHATKDGSSTGDSTSADVSYTTQSDGTSRVTVSIMRLILPV